MKVIEILDTQTMVEVVRLLTEQGLSFRVIEKNLAWEIIITGV